VCDMHSFPCHFMTKVSHGHSKLPERQKEYTMVKISHRKSLLSFHKLLAFQKKTVFQKNSALVKHLLNAQGVSSRSFVRLFVSCFVHVVYSFNSCTHRGSCCFCSHTRVSFCLHLHVPFCSLLIRAGLIDSVVFAVCGFCGFIFCSFSLP
jgi:hypothetical protein